MEQSISQLDFDPETEYRAIETALLESARGRWFLAEHGRRARRVDSAVLQDAIGRLQSSLRDPPALLGQLRNEVVSLQVLLNETRSALVAKPINGGGSNGAAVGALTSGPDGILAAAEGIHELAWSLHAEEISVDTCEKIARQASSIYALSVRHAAESERVQQLTLALDGALARLDGLLETIGHEAQLDDFAQPPEAGDAAIQKPPRLMDAEVRYDPASLLETGGTVEQPHLGHEPNNLAQEQTQFVDSEVDADYHQLGHPEPGYWTDRGE